MKDPHDIIIKPILTEKSYDGIEIKKYTFVVDKHANKTEIKTAIEEVFDVKVDKVNVANVLGKIKRQGKTSGRKPSIKKAYVTLKKNSKPIEFFEGMAQ